MARACGVHAGTVELLGRVSLSGVIDNGQGGDAGEGQAGRAVEIPPGRRAHARIRLEAAMAATRGDRFILRAYSPSVTIAGGIVLDPAPSRGAIRTPAGRARFAAIDLRGGEGEDDRFVEQIVTERGAQGIERATLVGRAGLDPARLAERRPTPDRWRPCLATGHAARARRRSSRRSRPACSTPCGPTTNSSRCRRGCRARKRARGCSRGRTRRCSSVSLRTSPRRTRLAGTDRLALANRPSPLSDADRRAMADVEQAFERAGLVPPDGGGLAAALGLPAAQVERALTLLVRQKTLVRLDTLVFHASALERLKTEVRALKGSPAGQRLDVAAVKERYGISRKFAIPLLEYLDRERVTRRMGDARVVL